MGFEEGEFGQANVLAQAKNTGMDGLVEAGIIRSARGKVRLLKPAMKTGVVVMPRPDPSWSEYAP